jgi:hypothetical protein
MQLRWDSCLRLANSECEDFFADYLDRAERNCLLIGGAGFDPRAAHVAEYFGQFRRAKVRGLFIREERKLAQPQLGKLADKNQQLIGEHLKGNAVFPKLNMFESDIPVGGRKMLQMLSQERFEEVTDIILDISALSCSVFFPVTRYLLAVCTRAAQGQRSLHLHLLTMEEPQVDHQIQGIPGDSVSPIHGFRAEESMDAGAQKPLLWIPVLAPGTGEVLRRVHTYLSRDTTQTPIDVGPIIPFPSHDPRMPDRLICEFRDLLAKWGTDFRSLLYAAESDPLDAYRTICQICSNRHKTFHDLGGSSVVLTPVGNKLLAVGAMLAAIEKNLKVVIIESVGYNEQAARLANNKGPVDLNHLWLFGPKDEQEARGGTL